MDKTKIVENNLTDLNVGVELAEIAQNDFVKSYSSGRIQSLKSDINNSFLSAVDLAKSYAIDLVLFIKISNIINDLENKDYFRARLMDLCNYFPEIKNEDEVIDLI